MLGAAPLHMGLAVSCKEATMLREDLATVVLDSLYCSAGSGGHTSAGLNASSFYLLRYIEWYSCVGPGNKLRDATS